MQPPTVICTIATEPAMADLRLWLHSLFIWNKIAIENNKLYVYVMGDEAVLATLPKWAIGLPGLQKYSSMNRKTMAAHPADWPQLTGRSLWDQFQLEKATVMRTVLEKHPNVLFTDCDLLFLAPLRSLDTTNEVILSPHYIKKSDSDKYGYYNGGWMWTRCIAALHKWMTATLTSRFHEQAALEDVAGAFKTGVVPATENFGWWRMFQADLTAQEQVGRFSIINGVPCYDGQPLTSIHTHFVGGDWIMNQFNGFILKCLALSGPQWIELGKYVISAGTALV